MKIKFLIMGTTLLFMGVIMSDTAPADMSKLISGSPTWRLEEMAGGSIPADVTCFCKTAANTGNGFCICKNVSDGSRPFVIAIKGNNHLSFPK